MTTTGNEALSASSASTVVVQDAFTRGGAGVSSNSSTKRVELADNFDFTVGKHQMRVGALVEGSFFSNFDERNAAGTWTYRTVEDFLSGRPAQFSQRLGTVDTAFSQYQAGVYWSDEYRLHRDVSLGIGVRNEMQSRIGDKLNLMPRVGVTWAPFGSQTSAIRGGYGIFYDWYDSSLYDQTLRVDGTNVRDIRISCIEANEYCASVSNLDALVAGVSMTPSGRIQASPDLQMPRVHQASLSYDRQLTSNITLQTSYQMLRGSNLMRSRNVNAPVDGVRPNPEFGDITQFESTGKSSSDRLTVGTRVRLQLANGQPAMFNVNYTYGHEKNHADGATSLPASSLNPDLDWGPSRQDIRHRLQVQAQAPILVRRARQREPERQLGRALQHDYRPRRQRRRRVQRPAGRCGPQLAARRHHLGPQSESEPPVLAVVASARWRPQGSVSAVPAAVAATPVAGGAWSSSSRRRTSSTT